MADGAAETCPKCGRARGGEEACPRCGLLAARFAAFAAEDAEPASVAPLWEACAAAWGEPRAHDRLIEAALDLGLLPAVARRYRARLAEGAEPIAEARLKQIAVLVETAARAQAERPISPRAVRALWALGYAVAALVLAASAWFVARTLVRP